MANWLEEAEREIRRTSKSRNSERTQIKKDRIRDNYLIIKKEYDAFIKELGDVISRINNLPLDMRQPFGQIDFREKDGKLDNNLIIISASRRLTKRKSALRNAHFKNVRALYISVSKYSEKVDIEVKEHFLIKKRLSTRNQEKADSPDNKKISLLLNLPIAECTKDKVMDMVSFVAFKHDVEKIPFDLSKALVKE